MVCFCTQAAVLFKEKKNKQKRKKNSAICQPLLNGDPYVGKTESIHRRNYRNYIVYCNNLYNI